MAELEYGLFRVPFENLQRLDRNLQKLSARHLHACATQYDQLLDARGLAPGPEQATPIAELGLTGKAHVLKAVQAMIQELEQFKQGLDTSAQITGSTLSRLRTRVCHLHQLESAAQAEQSQQVLHKQQQKIRNTSGLHFPPQPGPLPLEADVMQDDLDSDREDSRQQPQQQQQQHAAARNSSASAAAVSTPPLGSRKEPKRRRVSSSSGEPSQQLASSSSSFSASSTAQEPAEPACTGRGSLCPVHCRPPAPVSGAGSTHNLSSVTRLRFNRVLVDHLLREGMYATAVELAAQANISRLVDLEVYVTAKRILDSLDQRSCQKALQWCAANRARLAGIHSQLEFQLHVQEFVELLAQGKMVEAVQYSQQHLSVFAGRHTQELQQAMMAMAFPQVAQEVRQRQQQHQQQQPQQAHPALQYLHPGGAVPDSVREQIAKYFEDSRWGFLKQQFKKDHAAISGLTANSLLSISLQVGLSALKTPFCEQPDSRRRNCPGCAHSFAQLMRSVPIAERQHSSLVCRLSGEPMDSDNPPLVLPSGELYSRKALQSIAEAHPEGLLLELNGRRVYLDDCHPAYVL